MGSWGSHFGGWQSQYRLGRTIRAHKFYFVGFALPVHQHDGTGGPRWQAAFGVRLPQLHNL